MSFKAKVIVFLRYGLAIGSAAIFQYYLLKTFHFFKNHPRRRALLTGIAAGNLMLLLVPLDLALHWTLPTWFYLPVVVAGIGYQVLSAAFLAAYHLLGRLLRAAPVSQDRRRLLGAATFTALSAIPVGWSLFRGLEQPRIRRFRMKMAGTPPGGLRIVHVTDMHTGYFFGPAKVRALRDTINRLDADLICFTGDQLHNTHRPFLIQLRDNIAPLKARLGVFQVAGNHDHRLGKSQLFEELSKVGVTALDDRCVTLTKGGVPFQVIGIDDLNYGGDLERAMATLGEGRFRLLLSHRPRVLEEASRYAISLVLSGHTHGGQLCVGEVCPSLLETPYTYGLYTEGQTVLYVSSGAGTTGPPMRLFSPAEIALFEILPEDTPA